MNTHMEAFRKRYENNHNEFMKIVAKLKESGCIVYTTKSDTFKYFFKVIKDDKEINFGFGELPYHWYYGTKRFYLGAVTNYICPFTYLDVLKALENSETVHCKQDYSFLLKL